MVIPEGFAHGFQALQADVEMLYMHTKFYTPELESGLNFGDPKLKIEWPLAVTDVSDKDRQHPYVSNNFEGLNIWIVAIALTT